MKNTQQMAWKGTLVTEQQVIEDGLVVLEAKKIVFAGHRKDWEKPDQAHWIEVKNGWIWPGMIDIHIHGMAGFDTMDGTPEALEVMSRHLASYGVTGFLATTMTADVELLQDVLLNVARTAQQHASGPLHGAKLLGAHLEGPWINAEYKGAQNQLHIQNPLLHDVKSLNQSAEQWLRLVTIAPELPGALEAISYLHSRGVKISAGHTGAIFEEVRQGVEHGVGHFTHCFNAMRGLHHREPGVVGAAMYYEELSSELIADAIHVHPVVMKLLYRAKGSNRLVLVSDSIRATGLTDGQYNLGGQQVFVSNHKATLADGTLAGSVLTLNRAVENMVNLCGVPLPEAVCMATLAPAVAIGMADRKGKLQAGYDADLIVVNEQFEVMTTVVEGRVVYRNDQKRGEVIRNESGGCWRR